MPALIVSAAVLLSPVYLVIRAAEEGADIWPRLSDASVVAAAARTVLLTVTVTGACIAAGVPLAWLTARTDLPLRRMFTVLLALPLSIPSFIGGFVMISALGPGGMVQDLLEPLGVECVNSMYGLWGSWMPLHAFS